MNKKIALVDLIETSVLLTAEQKLGLLDMLPGFNEKQVDTLGELLAMERQFIDDHKEEILGHMKEIYDDLHIGEIGDTQVYVGSGKPS